MTYPAVNAVVIGGDMGQAKYNTSHSFVNETNIPVGTHIDYDLYVKRHLNMGRVRRPVV